jgi:hypothetical protein
VLATADVRVVVDALLVRRAHGLVTFLLAVSLPQNDDDWAAYIDAKIACTQFLKAISVNTTVSGRGAALR